MQINDEVKFKSRYGQPRTLTRTGEGTYTIGGETGYYRTGLTKNATVEDISKGMIAFVDFEGGPFVSIGGKISFCAAVEDDRIIASIQLFSPNDTDNNVLTVVVEVT